VLSSVVAFIRPDQSPKRPLCLGFSQNQDPMPMFPSKRKCRASRSGRSLICLAIVAPNPYRLGDSQPLRRPAPSGHIVLSQAIVHGSNTIHPHPLGPLTGALAWPLRSRMFRIRIRPASASSSHCRRIERCSVTEFLPLFSRIRSLRVVAWVAASGRNQMASASSIVEFHRLNLNVG